jgi:hypothetical protein
LIEIKCPEDRERALTRPELPDWLRRAIMSTSILAEGARDARQSAEDDPAENQYPWDGSTYVEETGWTCVLEGRGDIMSIDTSWWADEERTADNTLLEATWEVVEQWPRWQVYIGYLVVSNDLCMSYVLPNELLTDDERKTLSDQATVCLP